MANTYSQITMHIVIAVKYREALILPAFRERLAKYIWGIIEGKNQKSLAVNGTADHFHILAGLSPTIYIPDFVRDLKSDSSTFINSNHLSPKRFRWQEGYGIFSHSHSSRSTVINYILNQEEHHRQKTFRQEYLSLLRRWDIPYDERFLFEFFG